MHCTVPASFTLPQLASLPQQSRTTQTAMQEQNREREGVLWNIHMLSLIIPALSVLFLLCLHRCCIIYVVSVLSTSFPCCPRRSHVVYIVPILFVLHVVHVVPVSFASFPWRPHRFLVAARRSHFVCVVPVVPPRRSRGVRIICVVPISFVSFLCCPPPCCCIVCAFLLHLVSFPLHLCCLHSISPPHLSFLLHPIHFRFIQVTPPCPSRSHLVHIVRSLLFPPGEHPFTTSPERRSAQHGKEKKKALERSTQPAQTAAPNHSTPLNLGLVVNGSAQPRR
jgi:hypothetical protein